MPLLNYTTQIAVDKTVGEIQKMLGSHGAKAIQVDYEGGVVSGIKFAIAVNGTDIGFKLPCDWRPILEVLKKDPKVPHRMCNQEHAVRVAWRIVKDWVEAQMAMIDTHMVKTEEVFLSYAVMKDGQTLFEKVSSNGFLLGSGN